MLFSPFPPSDIICPHQAPRRSGSNTFYLPFRGQPGGCYVRPRPHVVRSRPRSTSYGQYHDYPSHALSGALAGLAGNFVDSLRAQKLAHGQQSHSQQNHKEVSPDPHQTFKLSPLVAPSRAEKAGKEGHVDEREGCCREAPEGQTGCCTGKEGNCCSSTTENSTSSSNHHLSQVWMQPVCLQGFAPSEVKVRVAEGMIHIHAKTEKSNGPGPCISRYEMRRTVKLPADVDQQAVSCVMVPNGNLIVYARRKSQQVLGEKNEGPVSVENGTSGGEQKEEPAQLEVTAHPPAAEQPPEEEKMASAEPADDNVEKNDFAKLAEKMPSHPEEQLSCEEMYATTSATLEPKRLGEMAEEILEKSEASENTKLTLTTEPAVIEEADEDMPLSPTPGEIEESVKWLFEGDGCCCCMDEDDYEIQSTGSLTDVPSSDLETESQTNGEKMEQEVGTENVKEEHKMCMEQKNSPVEENFTVSYPTGGDNQLGDKVTCHSEESDAQEADKVFVVPEMTAEHETESTQKDGDADCASAEGEDITKKRLHAESDTDPTPPIKWSQMHEQPSDLKTLENNPTELDDSAEPFCALIPLKGYHPQDIHVKLQEHSLIVTAEKEGQVGGAIFTDRTQRRIELPECIDVSTVRCVLREDGMLVITAIPKKQK